METTFHDHPHRYSAGSWRKRKSVMSEGLTFQSPPPNKHIGEPPSTSTDICMETGDSVSFSESRRPRIETMGTRPNANDACATIVQHMMMYNKSTDEEFARKACESLVKKMKDKRPELDALINAVCSLGAEITPCVTIQRTLDGRLQVAGRKGFPHVVYAKIFRWPDLHKNELKHTNVCKYAFDLKCDVVCVNPYHYERVISPAINSCLDMSSLKLDGHPGMLDDDDERRSQQSSVLGRPTSNISTMAGQISPYSANRFPSSSATGQQYFHHSGHPMIPPLQLSMQQHQPLPAQPFVSPTRQHLPPAPMFSQMQDKNYENYANQNHGGPFNYHQHPQQQQQQPPQQQQQQQQQQHHVHHHHHAHPQQTQQHHQMQPHCHQNNGNYVPHGGTQQQEMYPHPTQHRDHHYQNTHHYYPRHNAEQGHYYQNCSHPQQTQHHHQHQETPNQMMHTQQHHHHQQQQQQQQEYARSYEPPKKIASVAAASAELLNHAQVSGNIQNVQNIPPVQLPQQLPQQMQQQMPPQLSQQQSPHKPVRTVHYDGSTYVCPPNIDKMRVPEPPTAEIPSNWCAITYHEKNQQIGEQRQMHVNDVIVDGGLDATSTERFCLGAISNINRTPDVDKVRQLIGEGIRMSVKENGDVWLCCRGRSPVFVHCHYLDRESGRVGGDAIHKIYPGAALKVFDLRQCQQHLRAQSACQIMAREVRAGRPHPGEQLLPKMNESELEKKPEPDDDETANMGADDLRRICVVRVSFIKGWGPDYPRSTIMETPAWIEVHLNKALEILDRILHEPGAMGTAHEDD